MKHFRHRHLEHLTDVESEKIRVNDEFVYNLDRYKIIDLGKFESAYFDMYCEVIK